MLSHYLLPMLIPREAMPQTNKKRLEPRISQIAQTSPYPPPEGDKGGGIPQIFLDYYLCNPWFQ